MYTAAVCTDPGTCYRHPCPAGVCHAVPSCAASRRRDRPASTHPAGHKLAIECVSQWVQALAGSATAISAGRARLLGHAGAADEAGGVVGTHHRPCNALALVAVTVGRSAAVI